MRNNLTTAFEDYLTTKVAKSFTRCWKVTCANEDVLGFTTHTRDIVFDGVTYLTILGLTTSSVKSSEGLSVDNLNITAFLSTQDERDIYAGVYDGAFVEVFILNYFNLAQGRLLEKSGFLGEITRADGVFQAEVRGISDMLRTKIGRIYGAGCDARLGDDRCKFEVVPIPAAITSIEGLKHFSSTTLSGYMNGQFTQGNVEFISGANMGIVRDVRFHGENQIILFLATPFLMQVGDEFLIEDGCDKLKNTCINKFDNVINFRGFDYVPLIEQVFDSPVSLGLGIGICAADDPEAPPPEDTEIFDGGAGEGDGGGNEAGDGDASSGTDAAGGDPSGDAGSGPSDDGSANA